MGATRRERAKRTVPALRFAGFTRIDLRPQAVGGFDGAAREVEELAVARVVRFLDPLDMHTDSGMFLGEEFGEKVLLLRRPDDEDGAGLGDCLRDIREEWLVLLDPVTGPLLMGMKLANNGIPDDCPVRLFDAEVKNARPFVIDPDDSVVMIGHCGLLARISV
jgi:hypothetical protein